MNVPISIKNPPPGLPGPIFTPPRLAARDWRILVVDDDAGTRHLHSLLLTRAGYAAEMAADGEHAWELLCGWTGFHLVLTDQHMPRLTGLQLVARMRLAHLTLPVVLLSGCLNLDQAGDFSQLSAVLRKPVDFSELLETVEWILQPTPGHPDPDRGGPPLAPPKASNIIPLPMVRLAAPQSAATPP